MADLAVELKRKEAKTLKFTFKDSDDEVIDVSSGEFTFVVKSDKDGSTMFTKEDTDFDKTDAATGVVRLPLSASDLDLSPDEYVAELKSVLSDSPSHIDKSDDIAITIIDAVTD